MNFSEVLPWLVAGISVAAFLMNFIMNLRNSATNNVAQFALLEKTCNSSIAAVKNELLLKLDGQSTNIGNVVSNIGDRIHKLELAAMEARALAAETYMRRDSYHKATDEFKKDVRDAHTDLKIEMHKGFDELRDQLSSVSMSIEAGRKDNLNPRPR